MPRTASPDGRRITLTVRLTETELARLDTSRGEETRSTWQHRLIGVVLAEDACTACASGAGHAPAGRAESSDEATAPAPVPLPALAAARPSIPAVRGIDRRRTARAG